MQDCGWRGLVSADDGGVEDVTQQMPLSLANKYYFNGKLREYIGDVVRVEYTLGTASLLFDRIGQLVEVGENFLVLKDNLINEDVIMDNLSVKFVTIYK